MHLICLLEHLHGEDVLVDGTTYRVGVDGRTHVPEPAHAKALLANPSGWMLPPEPLMPLGPDGEPEHLYIPQQVAPAPAPEAAVHAIDDPTIVAPIPEPEDGLAGDKVVGVDFTGHVVTEADEIRAKKKAEPKASAVSAPPPPTSAKVARNSFKRPLRP